MKFNPDSILSNKGKKNKREAELRPYFDNTHTVFTPTWIKYKNPSLHTDANGEDDDDEDGAKAPKGKALLHRVYGAGSGASSMLDRVIPETQEIVTQKIAKRDAIKPAKSIQLYVDNERGHLSADAWQKRYNSLTPAEKAYYRKLNDYYNENGRHAEETGLVGKGLDQHLERVSDNYRDIVNHLEEHQAEGVGDPRDARDIEKLKREIKRVDAVRLVPATKVPKRDPLHSVSNPSAVQAAAREIYGPDAIVYKSSRPTKKYQIQDKKTGRWVHFGDAKMEDFTKHQDSARQQRYLKRALGIKGDWRHNIYSPNTLSILLLW